MANAPTKEFSIEKFKDLFEKVEMRKYMSDEDFERVEKAIEEKDEELLKRLFETLVEAQAADDKIVKDFIEEKDQIMDEFMVEAIEIKKKHIEEPRKEQAKKVEAEEKEAAEDILENL